VSLGVLADWASVLALLITLYNAYQITSVKSQIILNLTLQSLLERLEENSRQMNGYLMQYAASADSFDEVTGLCHANIRAVKRRLGLRRGWFCRGLLKTIVRYRRWQNIDTARTVYNALQQVIQEVANRIEERRITG
jgi:hypothetical protein